VIKYFPLAFCEPPTRQPFCRFIL